MKYTDDILFADSSFPIIIKANRASTVDDINVASQAMHEAIEIKYFYEGTSTLLIGGKTVNAEAGDVIIINPYEIHATVDYGKEEKGKYCLIMIGLDFFSGMSSAEFNLRHMLLAKQKTFKTHIKSNTRMQEILTRVSTEHTQCKPASRLAITGLMAEFFALLMREGVEDNSAPSSDGALRYYMTIEPAIRMIRDNYSAKFTIDSLADACNVSKYHFCRIFKAATGMSAIQYINSYRLKIADAMIMNTNRQISEITALCGFDDVSYFCRIYKKHFGRTPRQTASTAI